jgi:hypothetical protein
MFNKIRVWEKSGVSRILPDLKERLRRQTRFSAQG